MEERSLLGKRWIDRLRGAGAQGGGSVLRRLLLARRLSTDEEMEEFLDAGVHRLGDPFALPGMEAAVRRLVRAVQSGEVIGVYGDYDVDGQTSSALLLRALAALGADTRVHIPHRVEEGYGLNVVALEKLAAAGCTLIVTVDCGISAHAEAEWVRRHGLDLIVTDHHEPPEQLPEAVAIVNPKLGDDPRTRELAGCGVVFKLVEALGEACGSGRELAHRFADLAAVGTVADVVPLLHENRSLVKAGLEAINEGRTLPGIKALCRVSGVEGPVRAGHIAFMLGPRLNAVGRIGDPMGGLRLLLADRFEEALPIAAELDAQNAARRALEKRALDEAKSQVEASGAAGAPALVVWGEDWHVGVVGIVASRLVETYYRPAVVLTRDGPNLRGSGRSIPGFNLYEALRECADLFEAFGGHAQAAGVTLAGENAERFRRRFSEVAGSRLGPEDLVPVLEYDGEVPLGEIDLEWVEALERLEPFGVGNPTPVFVCRDVLVEARAVGKDGAHLKCTFAPGGIAAPGREGGAATLGLEGIGFELAERLLPHLEPGRYYDVAFSAEVNEWNGARKAALRIRDIARSQAETSAAARLLVEAGGTLGAHAGPAAPGAPAVLASSRRNGIKFAAGAGAPPVRDRRGREKAGVLRELVLGGYKAYVPVHDRMRAHDAARAAASTHPILRRHTFLWHGDIAAGARPLLEAALSASAWIAFAADPVDRGDSETATVWRKALDTGTGDGQVALVIWDLPHDPLALVEHVAALERLGAGYEVVLAFGPEDVSQLERRLSLDVPDRERLGRAYVAFKQAAVSSGEPVTAPALFAAVEGKWPGLISPAGAGVALEIFAELGLAVPAGERGYRLGETGRKVDLGDSVRYNVCNLIRTGLWSDFEGFLTLAAADVWARALGAAREVAVYLDEVSA